VRNFFKIVLSVLAALFGIQSRSKADEDFKQPGPWVYIVVGIVFIVLLVVGLAAIVSHVAP